MPRAEVPEGISRWGNCGGEMRRDFESGDFILIDDLPRVHAHWRKQFEEELREDAYCVEEFLRKVLGWEGADEDELAEAIESAEKLAAALDSSIPIKEGGAGK